MMYADALARIKQLEEQAKVAAAEKTLAPDNSHGVPLLHFQFSSSLNQSLLIVVVVAAVRSTTQIVIVLPESILYRS